MLDHVRQRGAACAHHRVEVDVHQRVTIAVGYGQEAVAKREHADVVDQHVDAAVGLDGRRDQLLGARRCREVHRDRCHRVGEGGGGRRIEVPGNDGRALLEEHPAARKPDPEPAPEITTTRSVSS
jgi:hypothetical protein